MKDNYNIIKPEDASGFEFKIKNIRNNNNLTLIYNFNEHEYIIKEKNIYEGNEYENIITNTLEGLDTITFYKPKKDNPFIKIQYWEGEQVEFFLIDKTSFCKALYKDIIK